MEKEGENVKKELKDLKGLMEQAGVTCEEKSEETWI